MSDSGSSFNDAGEREPVIRSWDDMLAAPLPPLREIIPGLLDEDGALVVAGDPGVGKSTLVSQLIFCLATGNSFLGFPPAEEPMRCMFAQAELPPQILENRLRDQGREYPNVPQGTLWTYTLKPWEWDNEHKRLAETITRLSIQVLALDPLYALLPAWADENSNSEMGRFLHQRLNALKSQTGLRAVVLVHHFNKPGKDNWHLPVMARMSGAYTLARWASAVIGIRGNPQNRESIIEFGKVTNAESPPNLTVRRNDNFIFVRDDNPEERIRALMGDNYFTAEEITHLTGLKSRVVLTVLNEATKAGRFQREPAGKYRVVVE